MENISFHGTSDKNARKITGPPMKVDISKGGGELGRGFYTGSSVALAAMWAQNRYKDQGVVIRFDIPIAQFVTLKPHVIKTQEEVISKWDELATNKTKKSYTSGADYILAPFAIFEHTGHQIKFESKKAETVLNQSNTTVFPCVP